MVDVPFLWHRYIAAASLDRFGSSVLRSDSAGALVAILSHRFLSEDHEGISSEEYARFREQVGRDIVALDAFASTELKMTFLQN